MSLKTQLTTDTAILFNEEEFGRTVGYYPVSGSAELVSGIVMQKKDDRAPNRKKQHTVRSCELAVKRSEVATPTYRDRFTFDNMTWRLDMGRGDRGIVHRDQSVFVLALERVL